MKKQLFFKKNNYFFVLIFTLFSAVTYGQKYDNLVKDYLKDNLTKFDLLENDINEWVVTDEVYSKQSKVTHVHIQQLYKGVPVFNAVSNLSIKDNKVVYGTNSFIKNITLKINTVNVSLDAKSAIQQTVSQLGLGATNSISLLETKGENHFVFSKSGVSQENIPVKLVYQPLEDGSLKLSWKLNIGQLDGHHWWSVRIDANTGRILQKNDWVVSCNFNKTGKHSHTSNQKKVSAKDKKTIFEKKTTSFAGAKYNVFAIPVESPNHGTRSILTDPQNTTASPFGWHDTDGVVGPEFTTTRGNNVNAQLDDDGSNGTLGYAPDGGADLNFDFPLDFANKTPDSYTDASLTNLFYINNMMHDIWYQYGFDEVSGNFQANNYGKGGNSGDQVIADGQDASGRNNADFVAPPDGTNPRMQMFIWNDDLLVTINTGSLAGIYSAIDSNFTNDGTPTGAPTGKRLPNNPVTADLALMNDGTSAPTEGCGGGIIFELKNKIVVIRRGDCTFAEKIMLAQNSGAVGVIMVNNEAGAFSMGGATTDIDIPAVSVTQETGEAIIAALENGEIINTTLIDYGIDGSFDNGIVAHEYGHGISNRLVGGPSNSGCLLNAEQLGEGWSDFFGLMITMKAGDTEEKSRGVGTFAQNQDVDSRGIRQYPYTTDMTVNPFTFDDVKDQRRSNGSVSVHGLGSIWATMLWDLNWKMINVYGFDPDLYNGTGGNNKTMQLVIEGLKLTPCTSGFEAGRDAILAADDALFGGVNRCYIWQVFARRGLGFGAKSGSVDSFTDQIESFAMPPEILLGGASCTLKVTSENSKIFTTYPNPSNGIINISVNNNIENATISIFDVNGRKVFSTKEDLTGTKIIRAESLTPGIYILKISNKLVNYSEKVIIN